MSDFDQAQRLRPVRSGRSGSVRTSITFDLVEFDELDEVDGGVRKAPAKTAFADLNSPRNYPVAGGIRSPVKVGIPSIPEEKITFTFPDPPQLTRPQILSQSSVMSGMTETFMTITDDESDRESDSYRDSDSYDDVGNILITE